MYGTVCVCCGHKENLRTLLRRKLCRWCFNTVHYVFINDDKAATLKDAIDIVSDLKASEHVLEALRRKQRTSCPAVGLYRKFIHHADLDTKSELTHRAWRLYVASLRNAPAS